MAAIFFRFALCCFSQMEQQRVPVNLILGFFRKLESIPFLKKQSRDCLNVGFQQKDAICVMAMGHDAGACSDGILHSHSRAKP